MDTEFMLVLLFIGAVVGGLLGLLVSSAGGNVTIRTETLDEVCVQLYGNGTESYNPLWMGVEEELKCRKIQTEEPLLPDSKIKFIKECEKC